VYTFLTVIHVIVCVFLMLVVLLQAGRGGGIGLAFGGGGGSQSVFGSSGGANFLTKLTAVCAVIFFTNSLALAYLSSQSDSRRLQHIAEKKALAKKSEDATTSKIMTDIEKQREAKENAAAPKSEGENAAAPTEGAPGQDKQDKVEKAEKADDKAAAKGTEAAPALKLTLPGQADKPAAGKLGLGLGKAEKAEKPVAEKKDPVRRKAAPVAPTEEGKAEPAEGKAPEKKAPAKKPAAEKTDENSAEKPAAE
jgi:preprotein translocase subunit SecG